MASPPFRAMLAASFALSLLVAPALGASPDPSEPKLSAAQQALFETPHLANVTKPETLDYRFTQSGPGGFTDDVSVTVADIHADGSKDLRFDFLTGDRRVAYPGIAHFSGNPLLMLYLEYDVRQMREQTGMAAAYFRQKLRQSFLDRATVSQGEVTVNGKTVPTSVVVVQPYEGDEHFGAIKAIAGKTYRFVMSPSVPGGIVEIAATSPADPAVGAPALGTSVSFREVR